MFRDVARSTNWRDRLGFVLRAPGWAYARRDRARTPPPIAGWRDGRAAISWRRRSAGGGALLRRG